MFDFMCTPYAQDPVKTSVRVDLVELDLPAAMIHHVILETEHGFSARGVCSLNHRAISLSSKSLSLYCQQSFPTKTTLSLMCEMAYISHG